MHTYLHIPSVCVCVCNVDFVDIQVLVADHF